MRHWRAYCIERCMVRSEGGRWKRPGYTGTSLAAYPTSRPVLGGGWRRRRRPLTRQARIPRLQPCGLSSSLLYVRIVQTGPQMRGQRLRVRCDTGEMLPWDHPDIDQRRYVAPPRERVVPR